jgi:hypothetical protein
MMRIDSRPLVPVAAGAFITGCGVSARPFCDSPLMFVCGVGLLVANIIWISHRVPWRRVVLGNVLLLLVTLAVATMWACPCAPLRLSGAPRAPADSYAEVAT